MKLLIALIISLYSTTAISQSKPICGRYEQAAKLMKQYNESMVFKGYRNLAPEGKTPVLSLVIVTLNSVTGSWTLYEGYENGDVCLIQTGIRGRSIPPKTHTKF